MTHGIIVAPQPEAVEAGAVALKRGGNAVDAAITCALVQGVVDPCMTGIAGFGSLHLYLPDDGFHGFIDFHTKAPGAAREDMWADRIEGEARDGFGFFLHDRVNEVGYQSIMVPGNLKGYYEAIEDYGTMDWRDVIAPAIEQADAGFIVRPHVYDFWTKRHDFGRVATSDKLGFTPAGRRIYFCNDGALPRPGERLRNPEMAESLRRIADGGADVFYNGEMAEQMVADIQANGGLLSLEDLAAYRTRRIEPIWTDYRGYRVASNQPPGGGVMVLEMLNILENFDLTELGHNTPEYIRVVSESMKYATIDKDTRIGDPDFSDVPTDVLIDKDYATELAEIIARGEQSHVERLDTVDESRDTTHICVIDEHGNAVSLTHSLGMPSGVVSEGLGFMYNGCMSVFDPRPGHTGSIAPGKSRFTAMAPTMIFEEEELRIVIGAPGGTWITMGVLQGILNALDFDMSMLEAVAAPRFTANSDVIDVCNRIPRFVSDELEAMGYTIARSYLSYTFAGVHAIKVEGGKWSGAADPGRDGMALQV
ncbi:MAG: gamma-glutamyltransferase [Gammaproteobacteria bacterium]|nr:gamma-glutamyltransferase [Gammaproteobacteria bacterium]MDX2462692.1 gamma-glutamyltransferase [Gammaproteobacteria bacterium]